MKTINHECYVSFEVAKLLKEAGFDRKCMCYYTRANGNIHVPNNGVIAFMKKYEELFKNHNETKLPIYSAPTLDVAQRWLREIRHRSIEVKSFVDGTVENRGKWWIWHMYDFNPPIDWVLLMSSDRRYSTYEEAQEAGIKKVLEIILEKGE